MFRRLFNAFFTILGGLLGYEVFQLISYLVSRIPAYKGVEPFTFSERIWVCSFFVIIFGLFFHQVAPALFKGSKNFANTIGEQVSGVSSIEIFGGTFGALLGLAVSYLLTGIYEGLIQQKSLYFTITVVLYALFAYIGGTVGASKGPDFINMVLNVRKNQDQGKETTDLIYNPKDKKSQRVPKILDTSVIIDGRILEILRTGFLDGPIIIPEFVLVELRHIADSSDSLKRKKGRRGLDILNKIQQEFGIEIYNTDEKALKEIPEVDVKLLKLAQIMKGKVVTNDFNLNKVAQIKNIPVMNINELANAVKPMVIPGEEMTVTMIKNGKDRQQAIAYLDDGTMIVVEEGRNHIGEQTNIVVTSVLQTAAGRMIFGKIK